MINLKFYFRYSKNPVISKIRNVVRGLKSRRLNSVLKDIYNNKGLREKLREKGIEQLVLHSSGYEALSLVPDPKHNEVDSWMGIGRMFYGNFTTYDYSDHPVTEEKGRLVFDDGSGNKRDLAGYLVEGYPDLTTKQIKRKVA